MHTLLEIEIFDNSKRLKTSHDDKAYLWHLRLDYTGQERIQRLMT